VNELLTCAIMLDLLVVVHVQIVIVLIQLKKLLCQELKIV